MPAAHLSIRLMTFKNIGVLFKDIGLYRLICMNELNY